MSSQSHLRSAPPSAPLGWYFLLLAALLCVAVGCSGTGAAAPEALDAGNLLEPGAVVRVIPTGGALDHLPAEILLQPGIICSEELRGGHFVLFGESALWIPQSQLVVDIDAPPTPPPLPPVPEPPVPTPPEPVLPLPDPQPPEPTSREETEADYWDALAELVEAGEITSSEVVLKIAETLEAEKHLTDLSRLDVWKEPNPIVTFSTATRAAAASRIRGTDAGP